MRQHVSGAFCSSATNSLKGGSWLLYLERSLMSQLPTSCDLFFVLVRLRDWTLNSPGQGPYLSGSSLHHGAEKSRC